MALLFIIIIIWFITISLLSNIDRVCSFAIVCSSHEFVNFLAFFPFQFNYRPFLIRGFSMYPLKVNVIKIGLTYRIKHL